MYLSDRVQCCEKKTSVKSRKGGAVLLMLLYYSLVGAGQGFVQNRPHFLCRSAPLYGTGSSPSSNDATIETFLESLPSSSVPDSSSSVDYPSGCVPQDIAADLDDQIFNKEMIVPSQACNYFLPSIGGANVTQDEISPYFDSSAIKQATRRAWLAQVAGAVTVGGSCVVGTALYRTYMNETIVPQTKKLAKVNVTQIARETTINITLECSRTCVSLDSRTFQKKQSLKLPEWVPSYFIPPPRVIKDIPNSELLVAAIVAGSAVEMVRTALLYPLQTLKTRIQAAITTRERKTKQLRIQRRLNVMGLNIARHFREGNLYAGLLPSLLVSVPATGVYYGVRDISKRMLSMMGGGPGDIPVALVAAFVADVVSLMFRTPADTLALRREHDDDDVAEALADAIADARVEQKVGNWFEESIERVPLVIATDLPYLLSRIALNSVLTNGQTIDIGRYELTTLASAVVCAFITTPFDVARTRILVDSDADPTNGIDGGSRQGLLQTFQTIMKEEDGGVRNLFAGCLERTTYLSICSLWLPFALLLYIAIRDTILLELFD
jgi:Mitochondrial carrier protein